MLSGISQLSRIFFHLCATFLNDISVALYSCDLSCTEVLKCVGWDMVIISPNIFFPCPFSFPSGTSLIRTHSTLKLYWFLFNLPFPWVFRLGHLSSRSWRFFYCHVKPTSGTFQQSFHFSITPQPQNFYLVLCKIISSSLQKKFHLFHFSLIL